MLDDGGLGVGSRDADDIESEAATARCIRVRDHPRGAQAPQPVALSSVHGGERMTEPFPAPGLHLDDDELAASRGDDVDLTVATSPVAVEDGETLSPEVLLRALFACPAEVVFRCHSPTLGGQRIDGMP